MAHRTGAVALLLLLLVPTTVIAAGNRQSGGAAAPSGVDPGTFDTWANGPVRFLLTAREKEIGEALSESEEFAAFRHWFWQRRDPVPDTLVNEFREAFDDRVDYVNKVFANATTGTPGWQTSKGVVYVMLGPPSRIAASLVHLYDRTGDTRVETWVYERRNGPVLDVAFVANQGGFTLLTTSTNRAMQTRLEQSLRRAAESSVTDRDLRFTGVHVVPADLRTLYTWPGQAALSCSDTGIDGEISIPLTQLYGHPEGSGLRVELHFEAALPDGGPRIVLGDVSVLLRGEVFAPGLDRELVLALWLPTGGCPDPLWIEMTEVASGRGLRLAMDTEPATVAPEYPVQELLASTPFMDGQGAAVAFIRGDHEGSAGVIRLLRHPGGYAGVVLERPAPSMWLVQDAPR